MAVLPAPPEMVVGRRRIEALAGRVLRR
jgi:hypothetical protein